MCINLLCIIKITLSVVYRGKLSFIAGQHVTITINCDNFTLLAVSLISMVFTFCSAHVNAVVMTHIAGPAFVIVNNP